MQHVRLQPALSLAKLFVSHKSATKLFVAGLSADTNETVLRDAFEMPGEIIEVKVICNHKSGESKRYAFVRFTTEEAAANGLKQMNGQLLDGTHIYVDYACKD